MNAAIQFRSEESRLRQLVEAYCNGVATDEEFAELERRLQQDSEARDLYIRNKMLDSAVRDLVESSASEWTASQAAIRTMPIRLHQRPIAVAIALAMIAVMGLFWMWPGINQTADPKVVCVLEELGGPIAIAGSDGNVRTGRIGDPLRTGDSVRTQESQSTGILVYPDGTRLSLVGKSSLTLNSDIPKSITVHNGALFASVMPQPAGNPMRIATHNDSLEVLGTRFTLDAASDSTDVSVTEGRVRLTRSSDKKSVDVTAGQRVVSTEWSALELEEISPAPAEWTEDFENGLPDGWESGRLVAKDLPPNSQTAVQSAPITTKDGQIFEIATADQWTHGMFSVYDDSHLVITYKMRDPGWLNILILTRTKNGDLPEFAGNYLLADERWWQVEPDQWVTASIPLSAFRPLPPARTGFKNAIPFQMLFSSPESDRGLVIDQISVKRGGPGRVVVTESP